MSLSPKVVFLIFYAGSRTNEGNTKSTPIVLKKLSVNVFSYEI